LADFPSYRTSVAIPGHDTPDRYLTSEPNP
jgi:hypothetical protein